MSHTVKIYDTCIGCTQCVRACPTDVLEMVPWDGCKAAQIASSPRTEDCVGCKRCETACPTDFLSVRVYLGAETTRSMGLAYWEVYQRKIKESGVRIDYLFSLLASEFISTATTIKRLPFLSCFLQLGCKWQGEKLTPSFFVHKQHHCAITVEIFMHFNQPL